MSAESAVQRQLEYLGDQLGKMEEQMIDPREFGRLEGEVKALSGQLAAVQADVKLLLEMANRSKGGMWVGLTIATAAGTLIGWALSYFKR